MATVNIASWDLKKIASVSDPGSTPTGIVKVQPLKVTWGNSSSGTGSGDCQFTQDINSVSELVVTEEDESTTRSYQVPYFDDSSQEAWIWVYGSWDRDGGDQAVVALGGGDGTDYSWNGPHSSSGTGSNPWTSTGVNAEIVSHDPSTGLDSSGNNNDAVNVSGVGSTNSLFGLGGDYDGSNDFTDFGDIPEVAGDTNFALVTWWNTDILNQRQMVVEKSHGGGEPNIWQDIADLDSDGSDDDIRYSVRDPDNNNDVIYNNISTGQWYCSIQFWDNSTNTQEVWQNNSKQSNNTTINDWNNTDPLVQGNASDAAEEGSIPFGGTQAVFRVYNSLANLDDAWAEAEWDASPTGGQTFFQWGAEQSTAVTQQQSENIGISANLSTDIKTLTGKVQRSNTGVQGAEVFAVRESDRKFLGYDVTDANGDYEIGIGPATGSDVILVAADYFDGGEYFEDERSIDYGG